MNRSASRLALALAAVLALAGCDRYAAQLPGDTSSAPSVLPATMYVKGITSLRVDQPVEFRAQRFQEITSYSWSVIGTGRATVGLEGDSRIVMITGTVPGPAVVRAEARDAQGHMLYAGSREIVVQ